MSDTVEIAFIGQQVAHLQAEVRSLRDEVAVLRGTMITRQEWQADRDKLMARLENIEAEVKYGFRQMNEKMDRQHAALLALLKKDHP